MGGADKLVGVSDDVGTKLLVQVGGLPLYYWHRWMQWDESASCLFIHNWIEWSNKTYRSHPRMAFSV